MTIPKAIKLPSAATIRPLDLAGLSSLTQMGVVAVLKPLPHPLRDATVRLLIGLTVIDSN